MHHQVAAKVESGKSTLSQKFLGPLTKHKYQNQNRHTFSMYVKNFLSASIFLIVAIILWEYSILDLDCLLRQVLGSACSIFGCIEFSSRHVFVLSKEIPQHFQIFIEGTRNSQDGSLTLGAHAQRGLQYLVCVSVCLSVCLSVSILALQTTTQLMSDTNSCSTTSARKLNKRFC